MTIARTDWQRIYDTMRRYGRREGFVDEIDGILTFFDSDPCMGGVHACHITIDEVVEYSNYETDSEF